jgi:hypothetical protein
MFDAPGDEDMAGVTLTRQVVTGEVKPLLRRKGDRQAAA